MPILQKTMVLLTLIARRKYFLLMVVTQGVITLIILGPHADPQN